MSYASLHHSPLCTADTGSQGSNILTTLQHHPSISSIYAYTRRPLNGPKTTALESADNSTWPSLFPSSPAVPIFFSGLGTTRAVAGGFENQKKVDYDLNLALAKAAAEKGCSTYVLISGAGASATSMFGYMKMKGEIERDVQNLGFKHVVIVRPGLLVGDRKGSRPPEGAEGVLRGIARALGRVSEKGLKDWWAQEADVIARAAVNAGMQCVEGKREEGTWYVEQKDIIRLGRTEWKSEWELKAS